MTQTELQALADSLCDEHGIPRQRVKVSRRKLTGGYFQSQKNLIVVSAHSTRECQENTLRHEVAHAIVWNKHKRRGHGWLWKQAARLVGATPAARSAQVTPALLKRQAVTSLAVQCEKCGIVAAITKRRWARRGVTGQLFHTADRGKIVLKGA